MELTSREARIWALVVFAAVSALLFAGLSSFGIWDPWELNAADAARQAAEGAETALRRPPLTLWLVSAGFDAFEVKEWAGRLPMAICGLLALVATWLFGTRFGGRRAGIFSVVVLGTTPLFLFNSRQMLGDAPGFAGQGAVALCAMAAIYRPSADAKKAKNATVAWLLGLVAAIAFAVAARGALLGALAPLVAVSIVASLQGHLDPRDDKRRGIAAIVVTTITGLLAFATLQAVALDQVDYSPLLGGAPRGGDPPTFDAGLEAIFHSFAPWSALVMVALGRMLWDGTGEPEPVPEPEPEPERAAAEPQPDPQYRESAKREARAADDEIPEDVRISARWFVALWAVLGYGAMTLYTSRYGPATFIPVAALALSVAFFLRDVESSGRAWWPAAIVGALLSGLLIRDFALYPSGPIDGLAIDGVTVPEVFNPRKLWAAVIGVFAVSIVLGIGVGPGMAKPNPKAPYEWLREQWARGPVFKGWMALGGVVVLLLLVLGVASYLGDAESLGLSTIVLRAGKKLLFVPLAIPVVVAAAQYGLWVASKLGKYRVLPVLVAGMVVGGYASHGFLPELSAHFSPREVYDTYNTLSNGEEPLGEYRVGGRAAAYYATGEIVELAQQRALIDFLSEDGRRWAAFPTDELPAINRAYRARHGRHLFVADARSARVVLASSEVLEGRDNENFLERVVFSEEPSIQNPVGARYGDKVELVGYDLELPHEGYVGAGESFHVTWYWRALQRVPGSYKIFLHIDGQGNRLNGDHEPVEDRYPVRMWDEGDIVADRQELTVPGNYRPGRYTFFIGFFSGNNRIPVEEGPEDNANRVRAGHLMVR